MPPSRKIPTREWERHKATILRLRLDEKLPLKSTNTGGRSLIQVMQDDHQFYATAAQYESQLSKWGAVKNLKKHEWDTILPIYNDLERRHLMPRVRVGDQILEEKKVKKARYHYGIEGGERNSNSIASLTPSEKPRWRIEFREHDGQYREYSDHPGKSNLPEDLSCSVLIQRNSINPQYLDLMKTGYPTPMEVPLPSDSQLRADQKNNESSRVRDVVQSQSHVSNLEQLSNLGTHASTEHHSAKLTELDSGFWTGTKSSPHKHEAMNPPLNKTTSTDILEDFEMAISDYDDARTEYSAAGSLATVPADNHCLLFATALYNGIQDLELDQEAFRRASSQLPDLLKKFSSRVGFEAASQMNRDVMYYVRKYRSDITQSFSELGLWNEADGPNEERADSQRVAWEDRINLLFNRMDMDALEDTGVPEIKAFIEAEDGENPPPDPKFREYHEFALETKAYEWLISQIRLEMRLGHPTCKTIEDIRAVIRTSLRETKKISRKMCLTSQKVEFKFEWDLVNFLNDQQPILDTPDTFGQLLTLTGSSQDAQVLTCQQYLAQTWPTTGKLMSQFIRATLEQDRRGRNSYDFPDGTKISIRFQEPECTAEVTGTIVSIIEVAEQLAWMASALRASPRRRGLAYCTPLLKTADSPPNTTTFKIDFIFENIDSAALPPLPPNGQCWHQLFLNPVLVKGYPVIAKSEPNTGIEIPLNIMVALAGTNTIDAFYGLTVIKGFSILLVPTRRTKGVLFWHMFYEPSGGRISYPSPSLCYVDLTGTGALEGLRHILGWSPNVRFSTGSDEAEYLVGKSFLDSPLPGSPLAGISVPPGSKVSGGPQFVICKKDTILPIMVSRQGMNMRQRQQWIDGKFVLLWDLDDERGWLVNGSAALLHLVKASLEHNSVDKYSEEFIYQKGDLFEPKNSTQESAYKVLRDPNNLALKLYKDDGESFGDRVDAMSNILEKMIEYQEHVCGDEGANLANMSRKYLSGWDFYDMARNKGPLYACMTTLETNGKMWVDFIRSLSAVSLFGRGFGQLIKPTSAGGCQNWTELPRNKFYIACCISDLEERDKINTFNPKDGHVRLGRHIVWHTETTIFDPCDCGDMTGTDCREPVQSLFPSAISSLIRTRETKIPVQSCGAVIFGQHSKFSWIWGDTGNPQRGRPSLLPTISKSMMEQDSGIGSTITTSSEHHSIRQMTSDDVHPGSPSRSKVFGPKSPPLRDVVYPKPDSYSIGIICALYKELLAVRTLFDENYLDPTGGSGDSYTYAVGRMGRHLVVSSCLPGGEYGTNAAADCASNMKRSFQNVKLCLLVGIAGGVPSPANDIRLGDVVVSYPVGALPGVIQYDLGKEYSNQQFQRTGVLHNPPRSILNAISLLRSNPDSSTDALAFKKYINSVAKNAPEEEREKYKFPGKYLDVLYEAGCLSCQNQQPCFCPPVARARDQRLNDGPVIHYGVIGSGNRVIKDALLRDELGEKEGILCVEMEAAGVVNTLPTLVIRGICDYSDRYKNKDWQEYSAATAAAYARMLLDKLLHHSPSNSIHRPRTRSVLNDEEHDERPNKRAKPWR